MERARRSRTLLQILLATCVVGIALGAAAQRDRCQIDALDKWFCAADPLGTAVVDKLGRVVCAPGACTKHEQEWVCSTVSGGKAATAPEGPVCDGECRQPEATDCEKV